MAWVQMTQRHIVTAYGVMGASELDATSDKCYLVISVSVCRPKINKDINISDPCGVVTSYDVEKLYQH